MTRWMERTHVGRMRHIALVTLLAMLLTACGIGGDDEEPTATSAPSSAQPTVVATDSETSAAGESSPQNTSEFTDASASAAANEDDADTSAPDEDETVGLVDSATPAAGSNLVATATPNGATEDSGGTGTAPSSSVDAVPGDGTSGGATPAPESTSAQSEATPEFGPVGATPMAEATPIAGSTPVAGATPVGDTQNSLVAALVRAAPPIVDSCDVEDVPAFTNDITTYLLTSDLNFRTGPGSDCDVIGDGPLGEFSAVDIIGGPVVREGDETSQWVEVAVGDQTGWLAFEFLEPAE